MQLVIFDIDGTLTDTNKVDADCFVRAFYEEFNILHINQNWQYYTHIIGVGKTLASKGVQYIINDFSNNKELQNLLIDAKPPT